MEGATLRQHDDRIQSAIDRFLRKKSKLKYSVRYGTVRCTIPERVSNFQYFFPKSRKLLRLIAEDKKIYFRKFRKSFLRLL